MTMRTFPAPGCLFRLLFCLALLAVSRPSIAQLPAQTQIFKKAQSEQDSALTQADSLRVARAAVDSVRKARMADTSVASLISRVEEVTIIVNEANGILRRGFDTARILNDLPEIEGQVEVIREEMSGETGRLSLRNLHLNKVTLVQMERQLKQWQGDLFAYTNKLVGINERLNVHLMDSTLRKIPNDSTLRRIYFSQLTALGRKWKAADSANKLSLVKIGLLQNRVANRYLQVTDMISDLDFRIRQFDDQLLNKEFGYLWEGAGIGMTSGFREAISRSVTSNGKVLDYYIDATGKGRAVTLLIILALIAWFFILLRHVRTKAEDPGALLRQCRYLYPGPVWAALLLGFTLAPYLHVHPPAVYVEILTLISMAVLTVILYKRWSMKAMAYWYTSLALYLFYGMLNLIVAPSAMERWLMLALSLVSLYFGWRLLYLRELHDTRYQKIMRMVIWLFIGLNTLSFLANIFGRVTLSKVLGITAISSLAQGVLILVGIEIIMEAFFLQVEKDKGANGFTANFNAILVKDRLRNVMLVGGLVLWLVKLLFNLNLFDYVYDFLSAFLSAPRTLGDMEFTFSSIVVFLAVIWVSTFISRFIGYLIEGGKDQDPRKKGGRVGSSMLLIRIGVLTLGILVAFTASGIALDKLAIIIGALGVGIGFGLQTIVNNLVSGIILAFEKPIQIGDIIEIGTRQGVVKEIGIRASKISTFDGSDVIVPNGDLLSQQLINWTHDNKQNRRVELIVGVAYGTDLERARKLILETMSGREGVQTHPEPQVFVHLLNSSSVDLRVLFWAADIHTWVDLKSKVLTDIHASLNREGIQIPFPQTDLHLRSVDPRVAATLRGEA